MLALSSVFQTAMNEVNALGINSLLTLRSEFLFNDNQLPDPFHAFFPVLLVLFSIQLGNNARAFSSVETEIQLIQYTH
jgi:hypothetical protein